MDSDVRAEINTLWKQGIEVLRKDLHEFKEDYREDSRETKNAIMQAKRWMIGLVVTAIPAYITVFYELTRK